MQSVQAMFAAMAVPLAGRLEARGRERETERRKDYKLWTKNFPL
ncbi:MAG: hypothetical protein DDT21_02220 [Syntrophomonadaceae bacterium]|nr:hypothetical protein [Bacillota bacterium]